MLEKKTVLFVKKVPSQSIDDDQTVTVVLTNKDRAHIRREDEMRAWSQGTDLNDEIKEMNELIATYTVGISRLKTRKEAFDNRLKMVRRSLNSTTVQITAPLLQIFNSEQRALVQGLTGINRHNYSDETVIKGLELREMVRM